MQGDTGFNVLFTSTLCQILHIQICEIDFRKYLVLVYYY